MTVGKLLTNVEVEMRLEEIKSMTRLWAQGADVHFTHYGFFTDYPEMKDHAFRKIYQTQKQIMYCECGKQAKVKGLCTTCYYRAYQQRRRKRVHDWL